MGEASLTPTIWFTQPRAMGSGSATNSLHRTHYGNNHRFGDEAAWWGRQAVDPVGDFAEALGFNASYRMTKEF